MAERVLGAIVVGRASDVDGRSFAAHIGRAAREELVGTGALVAAGQIDTLGPRATGSVWCGCTLVDVDAFRVGVASVAALARALVGAGRIKALAIQTADILSKAFVLVCCLFVCGPVCSFGHGVIYGNEKARC